MRKLIVTLAITVISMNAHAFDPWGTVTSIVDELTRPSTVVSIGSAAGCDKLKNPTSQRNCTRLMLNMQTQMLRKEEDQYRRFQMNRPETRSVSSFSYTVDANGNRTVTENGTVSMRGTKDGWNKPYERPQYGTWR